MKQIKLVTLKNEICSNVDGTFIAWFTCCAVQEVDGIMQCYDDKGGIAQLIPMENILGVTISINSK